MHREPGNDLLYLRNELQYSIFFQSTEPVNDLMIAIT